MNAVRTIALILLASSSTFAPRLAAQDQKLQAQIDYCRAEVLYTKSRHAEALELYARAEKVLGASTALDYNVARAALQAGKLELAKRRVYRALQHPNRGTKEPFLRDAAMALAARIDQAIEDTARSRAKRTERTETELREVEARLRKLDKGRQSTLDSLRRLCGKLEWETMSGGTRHSYSQTAELKLVSGGRVRLEIEGTRFGSLTYVLTFVPVDISDIGSDVEITTDKRVIHSLHLTLANPTIESRGFRGGKYGTRTETKDKIDITIRAKGNPRSAIFGLRYYSREIRKLERKRTMLRNLLD